MFLIPVPMALKPLPAMSRKLAFFSSLRSVMSTIRLPPKSTRSPSWRKSPFTAEATFSTSSSGAGVLVPSRMVIRFVPASTAAVFGRRSQAPSKHSVLRYAVPGLMQAYLRSFSLPSSMMRAKSSSG